MKTILIRLDLLAVGLALSALTGCVSKSANLDNSFGASVNALKAQQIIDPNASNNTKTATLDAPAALEVIGRYKDSYKRVTPVAGPYTIGINK